MRATGLSPRQGLLAHCRGAVERERSQFATAGRRLGKEILSMPRDTGWHRYGHNSMSGVVHRHTTALAWQHAARRVSPVRALPDARRFAPCSGGCRCVTERSILSKAGSSFQDPSSLTGHPVGADPATDTRDVAGWACQLLLARCPPATPVAGGHRAVPWWMCSRNAGRASDACRSALIATRVIPSRHPPSTPRSSAAGPCWPTFTRTWPPPASSRWSGPAGSARLGWRSGSPTQHDVPSPTDVGSHRSALFPSPTC